MIHKKTIIICVIIGMIFVSISLGNISLRGNPVEIIVAGDRYFRTEVVESPEKLSLGLGERSWMCRRCAMLFIFPESRKHGFWMKGMEFSLDIIWIDSGKIVAIEKNIPPLSMEVLNPPVSSDMVLEVNAGTADRFGWKIGDSVSGY